MAVSTDDDRHFGLTGHSGLAELATRGPVAAILWGTTLASRDVTYWLAGAGDALNGYRTEAWTAYEEARLVAAMEGLSRVAAVTFSQVTDRAEADFVIGLDTDEMAPTDLGFFFPPDIPGAGLGLFNAAAWDRGPGGDLEAGGVGFATLTHELLHGLGLAHPHDAGGGSAILAGVEVARGDTGSFGLNQGVFTTMSYNLGIVEDGLGAPASLGGTWGVEIGPMALDIAAIQSLYGANMTTAVGDDIYDMPALNGPGTGWRAIWDAGGVDTIRYGGLRDAVIDLRAATLTEGDGAGGYVSSAQSVAGGFTIAFGVVIENAESGTGNDWLRGNAANNTLSGYHGDDTLIGDAGADTLIGHRGDDQIFGGAGDDRISAGRGDDTIQGDAGDDLIMAGRGDDALTGGAGDDTMLGRKGFDRLDGGAGDDILNGGPGEDLVRGGTGRDVITLGYGKDTFVFARGDGVDRVTDFLPGRDTLLLDAGLFVDPEAVDLADIARTGAEGLELWFASGDRILFDGVTTEDLAEITLTLAWDLA